MSRLEKVISSVKLLMVLPFYLIQLGLLPIIWLKYLKVQISGLKLITTRFLKSRSLAFSHNEPQIASYDLQ